MSTPHGGQSLRRLPVDPSAPRASVRVLPLLLVGALLLTGLAACTARPGGGATPRPSVRPSPTSPAGPATPSPTPMPPGPTATPLEPTTSPGPAGSARAAWIGIWRGQEQSFFGLAQVENVLQPNGRFAYQADNPGTAPNVSLWGTWEILTFTDTPTLRFAIEGWAPERWCAASCITLRYPSGLSYTFRFLDRDTVVLRGPDCRSSDCEVAYRRVG